MMDKVVSWNLLPCVREFPPAWFLPLGIFRIIVTIYSYDEHDFINLITMFVPADLKKYFAVTWRPCILLWRDDEVVHIQNRHVVLADAWKSNGHFAPPFSVDSSTKILSDWIRFLIHMTVQFGEDDTSPQHNHPKKYVRRCLRFPFTIDAEQGLCRMYVVLEPLDDVEDAFYVVTAYPI